MIYDFDEIVPRRGTNSYKYDSRSDIPADTIPLWVADMDFRAAPPILDALQQRLDHGVFGYTFVPDEYYEAIDSWFTERHGWSIKRDQVIYTSGVVPAISAIIKALTVPGDKVLVNTPVYNCFFSSIRNNDCLPLEVPLLLADNRYTIDFEALEAAASDPRCTLMLLCNPHNPAGRVWTESELRRIAEICHRHDVVVVSDEIHCELVYEPHRYTPFATVEGECRRVMCVSPSKAFNIAGLQIANIIVPDKQMREKIDRAININEVCDVNPFGVQALIAAYRHGGPWLDALIPYLHDNYILLRDTFRRHFPHLAVLPLEGTYLAWVDCRSLGVPSVELEEMLISDARVWLNAGSIYGAAGEGFLRVNLACPRAVLAEALRRLVSCSILRPV